MSKQLYPNGEIPFVFAVIVGVFAVCEYCHENITGDNS